MKNITCI